VGVGVSMGEGVGGWVSACLMLQQEVCAFVQ